MSRNRKKNIKKKKNNYKKQSNRTQYKYNYSNTQTKEVNIEPKTNISETKSSNKLKIFIYFLILTGLLIISCSFVYLFYNKSDITIKDVYLQDDKIIIELNKNAKCSIDEKIWIKSESAICTIDFKDSITHIYTKDSNNKVLKHEINKNFSIVDDIKVEKEKIYLAINAKEKIKYTIASRGNVNQSVEFKSDDDSIATVDSDGTITAIANGSTKIHVILDNKEDIVEVISTDLITPVTAEFNFSKKYLSCNQYTKEENDLLDEILADRVNEVGYKTKAALVEVARFITLEFPYRINYFSENGRITKYGKGIDGEGRYFHKGLYLNSSRYANITKSLYGPGTWGCRFYSVPAELIQNNGLDCSGFISWIFVNAGFEVGDLGAGISSGADFTDLGERVRMTTALDEGRVKVGDLLSQEAGGEHIALIAGMNDGYFYVAESLWYGTGYLGAIMRKYDKAELIQNFYWLVDMKDFYEEEGKFTEYWIN